MTLHVAPPPPTPRAGHWRPRWSTAQHSTPQHCPAKPASVRSWRHQLTQRSDATEQLGIFLILAQLKTCPAAVTMASFLRSKQAGIQNDLSASIRPELFAPDDQARYGINSQIR